MRKQRSERGYRLNGQVGSMKPALIALASFGLFVTGVGVALLGGVEDTPADSQNVTRADATVKTFEIETDGIVSGQSIGVGGQLRINNTLVLNPSSQPTQTAAGQIYYDDSANEIRYYDGTAFQGLVTNGDLDAALAQQPAAQTGPRTVTNLTQQFLTQQTVNNYDAAEDAAIQTDNNTFTGANTFTGTNTFANVGVQGFTASGAATLQNSLTVSGASVLGATNASSLLLSSALGVSSGGTGRSNFGQNEIVIGQGTGALSTIANGVSGLCLMSTSGAPAFQTCPAGSGSAGVNTVNGLNGDLTITNSSASGSTITLDNATTTSRGIASFNAGNLSVTNGEVNTIQNIAVTAAPTFAGLSVNGLVNGQTISSTANFTGTLTVAGVVSANTITPNSSMVIGANGQNLTLQGNASTSLSATSGANTTTLNFGAPSANVTYRLQSAAAGTYDVCTSVGNCVGIGGSVTTSGGTAGALARFSGGQTLVDSILSESGSTINVNGSLSVDTITPTSSMTIGSTAQSLVLQGDGSTRLSAQLGGITNSLLFSAPSGSNKSIVLPNASGTVAVSASGPLALDANGNITCASCTTSGGGANGAVDSLNGINGAVVLNNSSAAGSTITIDDASTSAKGIASFNSTNFSVSNGAVNTVQDISVSSTPTFNALTLNTPLSVASGGTGASTAAGARTNLGAASSGANTDITSLGGLTTALSISQGGTGATSSQAAINGLSQLSTEGDLLYHNGTNSTRLARGSSGQCLTSSTTSIAWSSCGPGEADTLATVTSRGATTNTGVFLQGGATSRGLTIDTATATDDTISLNVTTGGASSFAGQITAADLTSNRTWTLPNESGTFCLQGSTSCGFLTGSASNYIQNQNASQQATSYFWVSGTGRADVALQAPSFDTASATALNIGTTNASVLNLNQSTVLAAAKSLVITGGATGTRPASPTEGMVYFDTTTKQLLVYANGKWQADRSNSTVIVAANNSKNKDAADFVVSSADETAGNADAAIQAAIATLPAGGGTIYLMEGTYTVDTGIVIPSNVTLAGAGQSLTIIKLKNSHNTNISVLDMSLNAIKSNITIRDLRLDGNKANQTAGTQSGLYALKVGSGTGASALTGITIRNVEARDFRNYGIHVNYAENSTIADSATRGNTVGLYVDANSYRNVFTNIESTGNTSHGISLNNADYTSVRDSRMVANGGSGYYTAGSSTNNNTVSGSTMSSNTSYGAYIQYGYDANFSDNHVVSNGDSGLYLYGAINPSYAGMVISGNTFNSNTGSGIEVYRHVANATINGNRMSNNTAYGLFMSGYLSSENPKDNSITGNYFYTNATGGIYLDQVDDSVVSSNTLSNNGGATTNNAIRVGGNNATNNSITGNVISDTSCTTNCYAIWISGGTDAYIADNTVGSNGTIQDTGTNTRFGNQTDASGNLITRSSAGIALNTTTTTSSLSLQGGMTNTQLPAPAQPTVARVGTSGSTTYGYRVTALDGTGETLPSTERTITNANATLTSSEYNTVSWVIIPGAVQYKVYRTTSGGTPSSTGLIGTVAGGVTTFSDTGLVATTAVPANNTTGGLSIVSNIQGANATLTGGNLSLGTTSQQGSLVISDGSNNTATIQVGDLAGNYTYNLPVTTANDTFCMLLTANCGGVGTIGALDGGTANATGATISGSTLYLQSASGTNPGLVSTTTQTFAGDKTFTGILSVQDVTVGAGKTIYVTGGGTGTRPGVPTEGMVYFDTTTKQLITYADGKWQSNQSNSTKVVAANNSSQSAKDAADYVATGAGDQAQINAALTAAAGGSVYLMEGTYYLSAQVSVPNNTTLSGAGSGTILTIPNAQNGSYTMVANSDTSTGTGVTIRDLQIDGNRANQTSGNMTAAISFSGMGAGSGSTARPGSKIQNTLIKNIRQGRGIVMNGSNNTISNNIIQYNEIQGINMSGSYNVIANNTFLGNQNYTINIAGSNHTITGNIIQGGAAYGILMSATYSTISGNTITANSSSGVYLTGIHATITGNTFNANNGPGVEVRAEYATVTGNTVSGNLDNGIQVHNNFANISSNNIDNSTQAGIMLYSDSNSVSGNRIHGNGNHGVYIFGPSDNNSILGNYITDTAGSSHAIELNNFGGAPTGNYLSNNHFSGTGASTINDEGTGTIYSNQKDGNGNIINRTQGGALTVGTNTASASLTLQGGMVSGQLTAPTLSATVTNVGTAGTTTYRYQVTAIDGTGETVGSAIQQTTTGNASLSGSNYNTITWTSVPGAVQYGIYKCNGAACTPLKKTTVAGNATSFNDQSAGTPTGAAPVANTTGGITVAGTIQGSSATLSGGLTVAGASTLNGALTATGTALFKNTVDSASAFEIQDSSSVALFTADTSATKIIIRSLDVSYNLTVAGHIVTGGSTPSIAANAAACTTPTVSVSGTDTAGSITVTTGTGCAAPGDLATVTFVTAFGAAPKIVLTPASAAAAGLNAYQDEAALTTGSFRIGVVGIPTDSTTYKWHYYALQ